MEIFRAKIDLTELSLEGTLIRRPKNYGKITWGGN